MPTKAAALYRSARRMSAGGRMTEVTHDLLQVQRAAPIGGRRTTASSPACTLPCMEAILSVLQVVFAVVLIFLVLMQSGKDSGLSGAFGVGTGTGPLGGG